MSYPAPGYIVKEGYEDNYEFSGYLYVPAVGGPFGGHATLGTGLISVYKFDGAVTTPPDPDYYGNDIVGGRNLELVGAGPSVIAGKNNNGLSTNPGDYFKLELPGDGDDFALSVIGDFTLSVWVYRTTGSIRVFYVSDAARFEADNAGSAIIFDSVSGASTVLSAAAASDQWNLFVLGYDSATKKAFASTNGEAKILSGTALTNGPKSIGSTFITVTSHSGPGSNRGADELYAWNKVLTDTEITALYAAGAGLFY